MTDEKKQKIFLAVIAVLSVLCAFSIGEIVYLKASKPHFKKPPVEFRNKMGRHHGFNGEKMGHHKGFGRHGMHKMGQFDEKHKKMAEKFEKELGLTDEQKAKIEANHEKSKKQMEEIFEQEKKLNEQKKAIMEQNKKDFEAILTDEQKAKLQQMHKNHKNKFEGKFKKDFRGKRPEGFRPNPGERPRGPQRPDIDD